jgi:bifunctional non-homologous end joining protein LigD
MIFDILAANGTDVASVPYVDRRQLLESILPAVGPSTRWAVPPQFTDGAATVEAALELALEGVVAKRLSSTYRAGARSPDWIKIKNDQTGDYVVGGWRPGRRELGALLVGAIGPEGLTYRGRVGGGISASAERDLLSRLRLLRASTSPFAGVLPREDTNGATWVRPELVVEVRYGSITRDGRLRFPRYVRLRPDKSPQEAGDA